MSYKIKKTLKNLFLLLVGAGLIAIFLDGMTTYLGSYLELSPSTKMFVGLGGLVFLIILGLYNPQKS